MASSTQAESVIKNIIREICLECSSQGQNVSETLAAFMVRLMHPIAIPQPTMGISLTGQPHIAKSHRLCNLYYHYLCKKGD